MVAAELAQTADHNAPGSDVGALATGGLGVGKPAADALATEHGLAVDVGNVADADADAEAVDAVADADPAVAAPDADCTAPATQPVSHRPTGIAACIAALVRPPSMPAMAVRSDRAVDDESPAIADAAAADDHNKSLSPPERNVRDAGQQRECMSERLADGVG